MRLSHNYIKTLACVCVGICMFWLTSCEEKQEVLSGFEVSANTFQFEAEGGAESFHITSDTEWTVETDADWCMVSPANGIGEMDCQLLVDTSYLYNERQAVLTFYSGSKYKQVQVNQLGFAKVIKTEQELYEVPYYEEAGKAFIEVNVVSNIDFDVVLPQGADWLTVEKTDMSVGSVPRPRKLKVSYMINTQIGDRTAQVELKPAGDINQDATSTVFEVKQAASPEILPSRAGDSLAVVMIARMLKTYDPSTSGLPLPNWVSVKVEEFPVENGAEGEMESRVTSLTMSIFDTNESLPFFIKYLTKLKTLNLLGNGNGYIKSIPLGAEVTELKNLEYLSLIGYGICSLPEEMKNMKSLIGLDLSSNTFQSIPLDIVSSLPNLRYFSMSGNRKGGDVTDLSTNTRDDIGLTGTLSPELFQKLNQLEYLSLSYNYFDGEIPALPVGSMPNLRFLGLNLNFFTGELPQWILEHPYLGCWNPHVLVFNQTAGKDSKGKAPGFTNIPNRIPECPTEN
ncbi:MAG: BACON domain-containing protein [Bacteroidales bacterium]